MPNCDWGKPCTCRECRTTHRNEVCPKCGFENVVELEGKGEIKTDRKGMNYAEITMPTGSPMNLQCAKCDYIISNVEFYTRVDVLACKENLRRDEIDNTSQPCDDCSARLQYAVGNYEPIELFKHHDKNICRRCLSKAIKSENHDPSNSNEKYEFDDLTSKWVISKIKVTCESCNRPRWLNYENRWKTLCLACYKKV